MAFDHIISVLLLRKLIACALIFIMTQKLIRSLLSKAATPHHKLPPGPKGWPIPGALPLLGSMPHVALAKMAKKYGPVMYLKVGTCGMVVASTPDAAKTFLKTLDMNFSNCPPNAGATHLAYIAQDINFSNRLIQSQVKSNQNPFRKNSSITCHKIRT